MRFKAELAVEQLQLLYSLIGPITRISQHAVVFLDPEYIRLSSRDSDGISCFAELKIQGGIFLSHRIESIADNAIVFEIDLLQWRSAMRSIVGERIHNSSDGAQASQQDSGRSFEKKYPSRHQGVTTNTIMRLAKRNGGIACLCLDGTCPDAALDVHHAIPIRIMRAADMQYYLPPQIQLPDVQLEMTSGKAFRVVVDRLKTISPIVYIEGSMTGDLTLRVDNDGSSIRTFFSKWLPRFEDTKSSERRGGAHLPNDFADVATCTLKVDTKKLSAALQWQSTMIKTASTALLCMVENEMLVVHVLLNPASVGFFTYYVPVHFLSSTELG